jgi:hypothetical protein
MNHIKKLQQNVEVLSGAVHAAKNEVMEIRKYLCSSKFRCGDELDGLVHVQDILNRLQNVDREINDTLDGLAL